MKFLKLLSIPALGLIIGASLGLRLDATREVTPEAELPATQKIEWVGRPPTVPTADAAMATGEAGQARLDEIGESLRRIEGENRTLRRQLAETNRDLAELQFQVDSHSESFRPLRSGSEPAPPRPAGRDETNALLPPP